MIYQCLYVWEHSMPRDLMALYVCESRELKRLLLRNRQDWGTTLMDLRNSRTKINTSTVILLILDSVMVYPDVYKVHLPRMPSRMAVYRERKKEIFVIVFAHNVMLVCRSDTKLWNRRSLHLSKMNRIFFYWIAQLIDLKFQTGSG